MATHTDSKLYYEQQGDQAVILSAQRDTIAEVFAVHDTASDIGKANGERLVACWNACRGIPTDMLAAEEPDHQPIIYAALVKQIQELRGELKIALNREAP